MNMERSSTLPLNSHYGVQGFKVGDRMPMDAFCKLSQHKWHLCSGHAPRRCKVVLDRIPDAALQMERQVSIPYGHRVLPEKGVASDDPSGTFPAVRTDMFVEVMETVVEV